MLIANLNVCRERHTFAKDNNIYYTLHLIINIKIEKVIDNGHKRK